MSNWQELFDDMKEEKEAKYAPIEKGNYTAFVYEAKLVETKEPPSVSIQWRIVDEGKFKNRTIFTNYSMNEKGIPALKETLRKLDAETSSAKLAETLGILTGREAMVSVTPQPKGDKTYYSVYVREHLTKDKVKEVYGENSDMRF